MQNNEISQLAEERSRLEVLTAKVNAELQVSKENARQCIQELESQNKDLRSSLDYAEEQILLLQSNQEIIQTKFLNENRQLKKQFDSMAYQLTSTEEQLESAEKELEQMQLSIRMKDDHIQRLQQALEEQTTVSCRNGKICSYLRSL
jgi:chromosome segregation ATPase